MGPEWWLFICYFIQVYGPRVVTVYLLFYSGLWARVVTVYLLFYSGIWAPSGDCLFVILYSGIWAPSGDCLFVYLYSGIWAPSGDCLFVYLYSGIWAPSGDCLFVYLYSGLWAPSGDCDAGFYCPGGDDVPNPLSTPCPIGRYCPVGSGRPRACEPGYFTNFTQAEDCVICPPGFYCVPEEVQEGTQCLNIIWYIGFIWFNLIKKLVCLMSNLKSFLYVREF